MTRISMGKFIVDDKKIFYIFFISYTISCVITPLTGFGYLDELCVLALIIYYFYQKFNQVIKNEQWFKWFIIIWIIFGIYSFWLRLIEFKVIVLDMIQLAKPFLTFICVYEMKTIISPNKKRILNTTSLLMSGICLFSYLFLPNNGVGILFTHPTVYGKLVLLSALIYLYTSKKSTKNIFFFVLLTLMSTICLKSRAYVEAVFASMVIIFVHKKVKFSLKYIILGLMTCLFMAYVAWSKINVYFGTGQTETSSARNILYTTSFQIAQDYFPLGTGFGSYGNDASRYVYSPVYDMYRISHIWGLSRIKDDFIADTFFPCVIGEFGVVGLLLFCYFFYFLHKNLRGNMRDRETRINYCVGLIIIGTLILESIAGPTIVTAVGIPYMMLIGYMINEFRYKQRKDDWAKHNCDHS